MTGHLIKGRVLIAAGSDSGGGAGIQADIKTVSALKGYAATAITALTAQNTHGVFGVIDVPPAFIRSQMELVLADIGADAIKTGMLSRPEAILAVAEVLESHAPGVPLVVDPVMVAKGGHSLLDEAAFSLLKDRLLPRATILTPNIPEAEALCGLSIVDVDGMVIAARHLLAMGPGAVLVKGGHLPGALLVDLLLDPQGVHFFESRRQNTTSTHGTGCTLASAIAVGLAQGMEMVAAVTRARDFVQQAIASAPGFGGGHGPLNHTICFNC
ncbi:MAG TPA: bifunctional hydroxymethylpyrimidine kinase/phosphomethylpyrimidine kinase [Rhodospirillaceae bacterium]|nr:bifunctional hydroxymethylpyrimidine kinase/phosphomethylpyrimidine kinase [Rhodospirillaceae bacterium]